jgi:hypothetical protein
MSFRISWQKDMRKKDINSFAKYFLTWGIGKSGLVHINHKFMTLTVDTEWPNE